MCSIVAKKQVSLTERHKKHAAIERAAALFCK